jgi:hypothetical protein
MFARIGCVALAVAALGLIPAAAIGVVTSTPELPVLLYTGTYVLPPPGGTMGPTLMGSLALGIQLPIAPKTIEGVIVVDKVQCRYTGVIKADHSIAIKFVSPVASPVAKPVAGSGGTLVGKFNANNRQITGEISLMKGGVMRTGQFSVSAGISVTPAK